MQLSLKSTLWALAMLLTTPAFAAFEACPQFFVNGVAPRPGPIPAIQRELCFDGFAVLHSGQSKTPVFVAERLNRTSLSAARGQKRTNRFYEEARLPRAERALLTDYSHSGYDRGHTAPAGDMSTPESMAQSFSLANMVPQAPENNQGPWAKRVEKATRDYVMRAGGDVFVFTGPVYSGPVQTIGAGAVWVPKYLYKLVYDATTGRAWAHWLENTDSARVGRPISYAELVKRTGIDFLPGVRPRD